MKRKKNRTNKIDPPKPTPPPPELPAQRVLVKMFFPAANAATGAVIPPLLNMAVNLRCSGKGGTYIAERDGAMDCARTKALVFAIQRNYTHALFLDCDHKHPHDIVERLLAHDVDVVGGLNFKRSYPHGPCASEKIEVDEASGTVTHIPPKKGTGLVEVMGIGSGCLMIRLECLKRIPMVPGKTPPWFFMPYDNINYFDVNETWPGEDGGFCINCLQYGVKMHCDTDLTSPHMGINWVDDEARVDDASQPGWNVPKKTANPIPGTRSTGGARTQKPDQRPTLTGEALKAFNKRSGPLRFGDKRIVRRWNWRKFRLLKVLQEYIIL